MSDTEIMASSRRLKVMIAGIGGASLGMEILKSLSLTQAYRIYGCDISPTAFGLYAPGFSGAYLVERENYAANVITLCRETGSNWLIAGGEQPNILLAAAEPELKTAGITLLGNHASVVSEYSDKNRTFIRLAEFGIATPWTIALPANELRTMPSLPCIVKPATGSGGSAMVFFATSQEEVDLYAEFIRRMGNLPIAQEYIEPTEGEFTIGVLSLPDGKCVGSIALRRVLDAKLSVAFRGRGGLISSGYSQGYIDSFDDIRHQAEGIAKAIGSRGPLNIQGRVRNGTLYPFEINPRFSASTYLRALAGFNEIDLLLQYMAFGTMPKPSKLQPGLYLRNLTEAVIRSEAVK